MSGVATTSTPGTSASGWTPKARVRAALDRRPTDRVPIFLWFHPDTLQGLANLLELPPARVIDALGDDIRQTWVGNNHAMEGIVHEHEGETHIDDWGIEWIREGAFNQIRHYPLQDATPDAIRAYRFPHDRIPALLGNMDAVMAASDGHFIGCDISPCLFEMACRLRGMEGAIADLAEDTAGAADVFDRAAAFAVDLAERACSRFALDWLWTGDDVGGQQAMIMSPASWRALIKPRLERIVRVGRLHNLPVAFHSCGAIRPILPDLIEIGVDVLNPLQCRCPGMDPLELKHEFGRHLTFMGGLDTQQLLPRGTAAEVRAEAARLIEGMTSDGGGFILAGSHTIPPETPLDNLFAVYEAAGVSRAEIFDRAADLRAECSNPWK